MYTYIKHSYCTWSLLQKRNMYNNVYYMYVYIHITYMYIYANHLAIGGLTSHFAQA